MSKLFDFALSYFILAITIIIIIILFMSLVLMISKSSFENKNLQHENEIFKILFEIVVKYLKLFKTNYFTILIITYTLTFIYICFNIHYLNFSHLNSYILFYSLILILFLNYVIFNFYIFVSLIVKLIEKNHNFKLIIFSFFLFLLYLLTILYIFLTYL